MLVAPPAFAQEDASAKAVLITAVPDPYELSPQEDGLTGALDPDKARQLGMPGGGLEQTEDVIEDAYVRAWIHPNGEDVILAAALKGVDDPATAGLLNGTIIASERQGLRSFDVGIPDARGYTDDSEASASPSVVAHAVVFRRGLYMFIITTAGPRGATSDLARDLAQEQFERAPEGETTSEFRSEPSPEAEAAYRTGTSIGIVLQVAAVVALVVFLVRRIRSSSAPAPPPGQPDPGTDPGEGSGSKTASGT